jgi:hypothetical protein
VRPRRVLTPLVLFALSLCVTSTQAQQARTKAVSFPDHSRAVSPNRHYTIIGVDSDSEPYHTVFLKDLRLGTRRKLFNYGRHIDLLWNPDSKSFALTDYAGSDYSRCSIVSVDENVPPIQLWDKLVNTVAGNEQKSLLNNHHAYIAATEWLDAGTLKLKVWGYGNVNTSGFARFYTYDSGRGIRRQD